MATGPDRTKQAPIRPRRPRRSTDNLTATAQVPSGPERWPNAVKKFHLSGTGPAQFKSVDPMTQRLSKNVTRVELCDAIYKKVGLSRAESAALVELVLKEIIDCLERGETVKLSSFGSFEVRKKGARIGRNPKTGKQFPISPRRVIKFKCISRELI